MPNLNESDNTEFTDGETSIEIYYPERQFNTLQFLSDLQENKLEPRLDIHNVINQIPTFESEKYFVKRTGTISELNAPNRPGFNRRWFRDSDITQSYNEIIFKLRASNFTTNDTFREDLEIFQNDLKARILDAFNNIDLSQDQDLIEFLFLNGIQERLDTSRIVILVEKLEENFKLFNEYTGKNINPLLSIYLSMFDLGKHSDSHFIVEDWIGCVLEVSNRVDEVSQSDLEEIHVTSEEVYEERSRLYRRAMVNGSSENWEEENSVIIERLKTIKAAQELKAVRDGFREEIIFFGAVMKSLVRKDRNQLNEYNQEKKKREQEDQALQESPFLDESGITVNSLNESVVINIEDYRNLGFIKKMAIRLAVNIINKLLNSES